MPAICEGIGFNFIAKDGKGDIVLGFTNYDTNTIKFKTYKEVIDGSI
jgi:hypothetical protein